MQSNLQTEMLSWHSKASWIKRGIEPQHTVQPFSAYGLDSSWGYDILRTAMELFFRGSVWEHMNKMGILNWTARLWSWTGLTCTRTEVPQEAWHLSWNVMHFNIRKTLHWNQNMRSNKLQITKTSMEKRGLWFAATGMFLIPACLSALPYDGATLLRWANLCSNSPIQSSKLGF